MRVSATARRCRISRTSATPRSARTRTSARDRSPPTSRTSPADPRERRRSGATSGSRSTLCWLLRSRLATTFGRLLGRSSPTTSLQARSSASRRDKRSRKGEVESGTIEQTLPGLGVHVQPAPLHAAGVIGLTPEKRLTLVSGRSHPALASRIAEQLGCELGNVTLKTFANGETYCRYEDSIRGSDVFIVQ